MSVLPTTKLGYTLGLNRNKDIRAKQRPQRNVFAESRGGIRMAGDRKIDLFSVQPDEAPMSQLKGSNLPSRFTKTLRLSIEQQET
tara:strand:+ start:2212 stop:2466 length:255 start_codon:yes stop_codon:yes gene_type:complete